MTPQRDENTSDWSENGVLPRGGASATSVLERLDAARDGDYRWQEGTLPLYVYWLNDEIHALARDAYLSYFTENGMGKAAFPSVQRLERDVISMALSFLGGSAESGGSFTSGGTESIFTAVKAARNRAFSEGLLEPGGKANIVLPYSAHPAFNKAAEILQVEVVRVPIREDLTADVEAMAAAIDSRTVLIAGSAPGFPHGVFDDIPAIAALASERGIWMHVDACVGGMLAPFMRDIGEPIPDFDLNVPGVRSLSADIHKYGYAGKGASLILLKNASDKSFYRFDFNSWPRGSYSTDTFLGTRPGAAVASAWAVMTAIGREGYREGARAIVSAKRKFIEGIDAIDGLAAMEEPALSFVLYRSISAEVDINAVADLMRERGWFVGQSVEPVAIHLMLNPVHAQAVDKYLGDLRESVEEARIKRLGGTLSTDTY